MIKWQVIGGFDPYSDDRYLVGHVRSISEDTKERAKALAQEMCRRQGMLLFGMKKEDEEDSKT